MKMRSLAFALSAATLVGCSSPAAIDNTKPAAAADPAAKPAGSAALTPVATAFRAEASRSR